MRLPGDLGQLTGGLGALGVGVARAAVLLRDAGQGLLDVVAAAGPGGLAADLARDASAHEGSSFSRLLIP